MKKALMIIGGSVVKIIVFAVLIIAVVSMNSEKLVCKSKEGNITIMYDEKRLKGILHLG